MTFCTRSIFNVGCLSLILAIGAGCAAGPATDEDQVGANVEAVVPGSPTALVANPLASSVALQWTAPVVVPAITNYLIEYKLSSASSWSTFAHAVSAATTATVTTLTNGSSYDFRVSAINSDGTGAVSSVQSATPNYLLNQLTATPSVAYATYKIRAAYASFGLTVRRASDMMTQNIGFATDGSLDTAAINTFCAATTCTVSRWYDQTTNVRDALQMTAANQPRIVNAGVMDTLGGRPTLFLNGNQWLDETTVPISNPYTMNVLASQTSASGSHRRLVNVTTAADGQGFLGTYNNFYATFTGVSGAWNDVAQNMPTITIGVAPAVLTYSAVAGGTGLLPYVNGVVQTAKTGTTSATTGVEIGARYSGNASQCWVGNISQFTLFSSVLTASDRGLLERYEAAVAGGTFSASLALAPTAASAAGGTGQATVSFTPPASSGGASITTYTVTSSPGGITATGTGSPIVVTGLTNGTTYTFTVTATNSAGVGPASGPSVGVLVGCALDSDCTATQWCDSAVTHVCTAKANTGVAIPSSGTCTAGASTRCLSGVCDADNVCGHANAAGPCTVGTAAGTSGVCRSGVCDAAAGGGTGLCRQCTATDATNCSGGTPICDSAAFTCSACNGDNSTASTAACGSVSPYCPGGGSACTTCGTAGATTTCTAGGATHAGGVCQATGACGNACVNETNCAATSWCDTGAGPAACTADIANGNLIPNVPSHTSPTLNGTCTLAAAAAVCASGVCDTDNRCGYLNASAGACTSGNAAVVCRSGACSTNGFCVVSGGCNVDDDCSSANWCDTGSHACVAKAVTGAAIPNSGTCSGGTSVRCLSGTCDGDNVCGHANASGPCTLVNEGGTSGQCRSGVCDPSAAGGTGLCRECTSGDLTNCSGSTPLCDNSSFACVACNGDNGTATTASCGALAPYCPGGGAGCTSCGTAGDTSACVAGTAVHAGGVCQASGACADSCVGDDNCVATQWCDTGASTATCLADLANGAAIPNVPSHTSPALNGTCTEAAALAVCASGVCDSDDLCGYADGHGTCDSGSGATLCRSGECSSSGTCRPAGGCVVDGDCASTQWCDTGAGMCSDKAATGVAIPGSGTCSAGESVRCLSGVCDEDNICGHANAAGPCTVALAAGTDGLCRSGVCDASGASGAGLCQECTTTDATNCTGGTPICDSGTSECVACNGDNGSSGTANCDVSAPYCPGGGGACTTCGTAGETAACTDSGAAHAGGICQPTGACADPCLNDGNCAMTQWCNTDGMPPTCSADLSNGTPIPSVSTHTSPVLDGTCTEDAAALVCHSGVCDTGDNACGYANGTGTCTSSNAALVCRSGSCSVAGTCKPATGCNADGDCTSVQWCDTIAHTCEARAATGSPIPASGTCSGGVSTRCASGVCGSDNICGRADGTGPCTVGMAAGTSGLCRSGVCDATGTGTCRECTAADSSNCTGSTASCDTATFACSACNGDNGTAATAACGAAAPYCPGGGAACTDCGEAGSMTACTASGAMHSGTVCGVTGACGNGTMDGGMGDGGMGDGGRDGGVGTDGAVVTPPVEDSGCGCSVPGTDTRVPFLASGLFLLVGGLMFRRRRSSKR